MCAAETRKDDLQRPAADAGQADRANVSHVMEHVRVRALPDHLPQSIHYSIVSLATFDDLIHVSDLVIPSDATLLNDPSEVVAKVLPPRVEEEPEVAAVAEGEEGAEGAAEGAEGAAPTESTGSKDDQG